MKAEHRKELQTNALANRLGKFLQNVKAKPQKRTVLYWILGLAVVAGVAFFFLWQARGRAQTAKEWETFDAGDPEGTLVEKKTAAGRAERFQRAWGYLWDGAEFHQQFRVPTGGIKFLMSDPRRSLYSFEKAKQLYTQLAEECKEEPILGAEAVYALAVIEESLAATFPIFEPDQQLKKAASLYRDVEDKFPNSPLAAQAGQRAKDLRDENKRREIGSVYGALNARILPELQRIKTQLDQKRQ